MPLARASRRGFALNWRFAVKGIQKASSASRERGSETAMRCSRVAKGWLGRVAAPYDKEMPHVETNRRARSRAPGAAS